MQCLFLGSDRGYRIASMLRLAALLAVMALAPAIQGQNSASASPACPPSATLDQLITALDDAVSGPADKDRSCLRHLLLPEARLAPMATPPGGGGPAPRILTIDGWIDAVRQHGSTPFYERQIKYRSETFGQIAHLWSTYEIRPTPDGKASTRGINSIEAVRDGEGWKVLEIVWQTESASVPLPAEDLPQG